MGGGGFVPHDKCINGGGGDRPYGGPKFYRLYHKLKVLLL